MRWRSTDVTRCLSGCVLLLAAAFAFKTLATIDLTSLWNDELRTVEKSFQPSLAFLLRYLRADVHPPLYYGVLWLFGQIFGQTLLVLRGFSWLCYLIAAFVLPLAVWQWRHSAVAAAVAGLLAVSLPFSVRFAVEGKAYSLMFALVAVAMWQRQRVLRSQSGAGLLYPLAFAGAALTHYYGLGLLLAQALLDGLRRDGQLLRLDCWALVLPSVWMLSTLRFLLGDGGRQWIPPASPELLQKLVVLSLGVHWRAVVAVAVGLALSMMLANRDRPQAKLLPLLQAWGLDAAALLAVSSFLISIWRPSAVDRYYIVLLPACIGVFSGWLGEQIDDRDLLRWRGVLLLICCSIVLSLWWTDSFLQIAPAAGQPYRKGQDFRSVSIQAASIQAESTLSTSMQSPSITGSPRLLKVSRQCRQLNASDHILAAAGLVPARRSSWLCPAKGESMTQWLTSNPVLRPGQLLLWASLGRQKGADAVPVKAELQGLRAAGLTCARMERMAPSTVLVRCRR